MRLAKHSLVISERLTSLSVAVFYFWFLLMSPGLYAATTPGISYQGRILDPSGRPLAAKSVSFYLRLAPSRANCILFAENQTIDMSSGDGTFSLIIGRGVRSDRGSLALGNIFDSGLSVGASSDCPAGFTRNANDTINLSVAFNDGTGYQVLPAMEVTSSPYAMDSLNVAGVDSRNVLRFSNTAVAPLSNANFNELTALLGGTSTKYVKASTDLRFPAADGTAGQVLATDGSGVLNWVDQATGTGGGAGILPMSNGGTGANTQQEALNNLTGTQAAGKYLRSDGTNSSLSVIQAADVPVLNQNTTGTAASFTGSLAGDVTGPQGTTAIADTVVTGKTLTGFSSSTGTITASDTILTAINKLTGNFAALTPIPSQTGSSGKFLTTNGTDLSWGAAPGANFSSLAGATGTNSIDNLNFAQTWNWSTATSENSLVMSAAGLTTGNLLNLNANALTSGSLLNATSSSAGLNSTNGILYVANTGASTTGMVARIQSNSTVGSGVSVLANGNVGVGTTSPGAPLDVKGAIHMSGSTSGYTGFQPAAAAGSTVWTLPAADGTNGQVLTTDGSGILSWSTASGGGGGITSLNGLTAGTQTFGTPGTTGTAPNWSSATSTHTLNIPMASGAGVTAGLLSKTDYDAFNGKMGTTLTSGNIFVGNASNVATGVAMSGDATIANTGAVTVGKIQGKSVVPVAYATGQHLRYDGTNWVNGLVDAATDLTGITSVANGGTGASSLSSGNLLVGAGTGAVTSLAAASSGNIVYATGVATWASGSADTAGLVDKTSTQTISGAKAFSNSVQLNAQNELRLADSDSSNYVALRAPATVAANVQLTLPSTTGTTGQTLITDGGGNLSWNDFGLPANTLANHTVRVCSIGANITLSGIQTINGVSLAAGDRILVKNQTLPPENGVYVVASGAWTRGTDMDTWAETIGYHATVLEGNLWSGMSFSSTASPGGTLGTTALFWNSEGYDGTSNSTAFGKSALTASTSGQNNTAIGSAALMTNSSGWNNTALGSGALVNNSTASGNSALGYASLTGNVSGFFNTALGYLSMSSNVTGSGNVAIGSLSAISNDSGLNNIAIGRQALLTNVTSSESTAIGFQSMKSIFDSAPSAISYNTAVGAYSLQGANGATNDGIKNTALGHSALKGISSGSGNVGIGHNAGSAITTGSNNIVIGSNTGNGIATSSNNILIADGAGNERLRIDSSGNVGIGTTTPGAPLDVMGAIRMSGSTSGYTGFQPAAAAGTTVWTLPAADGTNGQVLSTNGAGILSWSTASSGGLTSLNGLTAGTQTFGTPGTTGTAPNWSSATSTHTLNIPMASGAGVTAGLLSKTDYDAFNGKMGTTLTSGNIFVGNASNVATGVAMSGDASLDNTGAVTVNKLQGKTISPTTYASGQVLRYDGTNWVNTLVNAATDLTGITSVANGGTGATSLSSGNLLVGAGTGAVTSLAAASSGNIVYATGVATWASGSADTAGLVDKTSTQTISGAKAFSNSVQLNAQNELRLADSDSSNYVGLRAPATVSVNTNFVLPASPGTSGQILSTDGSGIMSWVTPSIPSNTVITHLVRVASLGSNLTLSGLQTVDGVSLASGDRVLVKGQTAPSENGVYVVNSGPWTRATDIDTWAETIGYTALVNEGTYGVGLTFASLTAIGGTLNSSAISWSVMGTSGARHSTMFGEESQRMTTTGTSNTSFGSSTLFSNSSGSDNTAVGAQALATNTSGGENTGIGFNSLNANTTGILNTALGSLSLGSNTTGSANVAIGFQTQFNNDTGADNVSMGRQSLMQNLNMNQSTAIGAMAMRNMNYLGSTGQITYNTAVGANSMLGSLTLSNNTGTMNTALGHSALKGLASGSGNIGLGYNAGSAITTGSNNIVIGSNTGSGIATSSNNILIADGAGNERLRIDSSGNVGIGTTTPGAPLDVKGEIRMSGSTSGYTGFQPAAAAGTTIWTLPAADGTNGQVLTTNGAGILSWSTPSSGGLTSLNGLTAGTQTFGTPGTTGTAPNWSSATSTHTLNIPMASGAGVTAGLLSKTDYDSFNGKMSTTLTSGNLFVGNASNVATGVAMSGDATIANTGAVTVGKIQGKSVVPVAYATGQVLRYDGTNWVNALVNAATDLTGVTPVANGGTGVSTLGSGNLLVGAGTGAVTSLAAASSGNIVYATGVATWASGSADTAGLVDKTSTQTISGVKAFSNSVQLNAQNELRLADSDSSNYVGLRAPATVAANVQLTLPSTTGTSGQVLTTDGAGILTWATSAGGSSLPASAGTAAAPGYAFSGNTNTGLFGAATNQIGLSTNGVERLRIDATGNVGIGTASPANTLDVAGNTRVSGAFNATAEKMQSSVSSGTAVTLGALTSGNIYNVTMTDNATVTLPTDPGVTNGMAQVVVVITQDATGSRTLAWAAPGTDTILWNQGSTPTVCSAATQKTIYQFIKMNGDSNWYGSQTWRQCP